MQSATGKFDLTLSMMSRTIPPPVMALVQMIVSGVFDRLPELRIYLAETNASWMPGVFYMIDDSYGLFRHWYGVDLAMAPSEYAVRHFYYGIVRDPLALRMGDLLPDRSADVGFRLPPLGHVVPGVAPLARRDLRRGAGRRPPPYPPRQPVRLLGARRAGRAHPHASVNLSLRSRVIEDKRPSGQARKCAPTSTGFAAQAQATELGLPATPTTVGRDDVPIRAPLEPVAA